MSELKPRVAITEQRVDCCHSCPHFDSHTHKDGNCTVDFQNWVKLPNTDNKPRIILDSCPLPFYASNSSLTAQLAEAGQIIADDVKIIVSMSAELTTLKEEIAGRKHDYNDLFNIAKAAESKLAAKEKRIDVRDKTIKLLQDRLYQLKIENGVKDTRIKVLEDLLVFLDSDMWAVFDDTNKEVKMWREKIAALKGGK